MYCIQTCFFFLIRRICFSPYARLLLVISDIASRPKICAKFPGLYKLVRSPIGICFFIRENTHTHTHVHTCAHIHGGNGNIVQRIIFISYYNLNRTERDEIYNTDTNISLIISKCKIFVESWFLTNNSFMMLKKKKFCFYSIVNIFFFFIENLLFKI